MRLALAMIELVGEQGYRTTTVADVIARAGMSRKAFYEQFSNKQECLLVTFDMVAAEVTRRVGDAYRAAEGWPDRVQAAIRALLEAAIEHPAALRLALLEIGSAGPAGIERRERSLLGYESFIRDALALAPGEGEVSDTVLKAIVGGLHRVLYLRVLSARDADPLARVPELVAWMTSYYPTPPELLAAGAGAGDPADTLGGRAPGTLAPLALLSKRRGLPRGEHNVSRSFVVHNQRERILDAVANLTAHGGYAELRVEGIAERAAVSLNAFYELFAGKEDAFLVAYEVGHGRCLAVVEAAFAAEQDWRLGVRSGLTALLRFLAGEPSFAHMALIDALIATPRTAERSAAGVAAFGRMLVPAASAMPGQAAPPEVTVQAISAGIFELCLHHALQGRTGELAALAPSATYIALAPFLGAEEAVRVALAPPAERG